MSILQKLFGSVDKNKKPMSENQPMDSKDESYIDSANKICNKDYQNAIDDLLNQLSKSSPTNIKNLGMIHINLMDAYFKARNENPEYFDLSTHHAGEALKYGHNTGLAAYRLILNLEKKKKYKQAIEVCEIVTDPGYVFGKHAYKGKDEFVDRQKKLEAKLEKQGETDDLRLFEEDERKMIIYNSKMFKL